MKRQQSLRRLLVLGRPMEPLSATLQPARSLLTVKTPRL